MRGGKHFPIVLKTYKNVLHQTAQAWCLAQAPVLQQEPPWRQPVSRLAASWPLGRGLLSDCFWMWDGAIMAAFQLSIERSPFSLCEWFDVLICRWIIPLSSDCPVWRPFVSTFRLNFNKLIGKKLNWLGPPRPHNILGTRAVAVIVSSVAFHPDHT